MSKNKFKYKNKDLAIEKHETAPLTNIERMKPVSRVPIPNITEVINAKKWVEENQK